MGTLIRRKTFETNSSSTHSITICTADEFEKFTNGELLFIKDEQKFLKPEEVETFYREEALMNRFDVRYDRLKSTVSYKDTTLSFDNWKDEKKASRKLLDMYSEDLDTITEEEIEDIKENDYWTESPIDYDTYCECIEDYEWYDKSYTTETGDKIVAFGYYGYDV